MDNALIKTKFAHMGARAQVHEFVPRSWRDVMTGPVRIDVRQDRKGEFFDLSFDPDQSPRFQVLDIQATEKHLLLKVDEARFLCGHDERHWFVAAIREGARASNVRDAREALMPEAVHESLAERRVKRRLRHRRRNDAFIRQGEWFFIPDPGFRVNMRLVLMNEPLRRGNGKPHFVQYLYRVGGESVYVSHVKPNGLTEAEYLQWVRDHPKRRDVLWQVMRRNPRVYARGKVRHPDHKTIDLNGWHRVEMNTETKAQAMAQVAFLD